MYLSVNDNFCHSLCWPHLIAALWQQQWGNYIWKMAPNVIITMSMQWHDIHSRNNIYYSIWDCWTIFGHEDFTLSDFMNAVRVRNIWLSLQCCLLSNCVQESAVPALYFCSDCFCLQRLVCLLVVLGKVWNWTHYGRPRCEDAVRACDAWTLEEAQTDVSAFLSYLLLWKVWWD